MRVAHFAPAVLPYQTHLYNAIAKLVDLHVVYLSEPKERHGGQLWTGFDDQWGAEPGYEYSYADTRSFSLGSLDMLVVGPRRLGAVLDELRPDVVSVTSWTLASISPILWARKRHIPVVMWSESGGASGLLRDPLSNAYRRWLLQACDAYLTVGPAAREYVTQLGAAPDQCVESCLPSTGFVQAPVQAPEEKEGRLRILWVGRLIRRKRPEVAVEAFGRIAREFNGASLTIVGDGPLEARVRSAAIRVGGSIELVGRVEGERLSSIYRRHDVLMVTAVREVWGLVVNEALAHDLYVIASDQVGAARCLLEERSGRIVPPDDVEAFADALRGFIATRHDRPRGISAGGRVRLCTTEAFAEKYVQALDLAVSRRAAIDRNRETVSAGNVRLVQTAIGDYRQAFLEALISRMGERFQAYAGEIHFDGTTRTRVHIGSHLHPVRNRFLLRRRFLWQSGAVSAAVGAQVAVLEYNPRILSVWVALVMRRFLRRRTLLWGHAWSRKGQTSPTNVFRGAMRWLSDGLIVYTRTQGQELAGVRPRRPLFVAPNAIYRQDQIEAVDCAHPRDFLCVGRLVTQKRPDLLLKAFSQALDRLPVDSRLVFIGEGPMEGTLRKAAASLPAGRVVFQGHVADVELLRSLYARSIASVSPGYVGLSMTQSLGFGVPMVVARDEPHAPEIEAAIEGFNCLLFAPTTAEALAEALVTIARDAPTWVARRAAISEACRRNYSAETMADGFISAIEGA